MRRFDPNFKSEVRRKAFADVMPIVRQRQRGDFVTHQEISEATGIIPYGVGWGLLIHHVKKMARKEMGVVLAHINGKDHQYKLLTVDEQLNDNTAKRERRAYSQLRRGRAELASTPDTELNDSQRQTKYFRLESLATKQQSLKDKDDLIASLRPKAA